VYNERSKTGDFERNNPSANRKGPGRDTQKRIESARAEDAARGAGQVARVEKENKAMKPIKDCQYAQDDGCCGYPDTLTPECHVWACPRLEPWIEKAIEVCQDTYILAEDRTDTWPEPCEDTEMLSLMVAAKGPLDAARGV
jgi:hypothetical protein